MESLPVILVSEKCKIPIDYTTIGYDSKKKRKAESDKEPKPECFSDPDRTRTILIVKHGRSAFIYLIKPPSEWMICPVIHSAFSSTKKPISFAAFDGRSKMVSQYVCVKIWDAIMSFMAIDEEKRNPGCFVMESGGSWDRARRFNRMNPSSRLENQCQRSS